MEGIRGWVLRGHCHCGNLGLSLQVSRPPDSLPIRACACSFCAPRAKLWTAAPDGRVNLFAADPGSLSRYRFGTGTADFLVCARCGINIAATCEIDDRLYAVLNARLLPIPIPIPHDTSPLDFDGESVDNRLSRRKKSWTPAVMAPPQPLGPGS